MKNSHVGRRFQPAIFAFSLALLTTGGGVTILNAQTPLARFVLPTNTTSTAVQPTFEIITSLPIDTTSVHWNLTWVDSTHVLLPVVCVIPSDLYSGNPNNSDSVWQQMAQLGTGSIIDDTTIEFTSNSLGNGNNWEVILTGLRVISGGDTIKIPDSVARMALTTINLPPTLVSLSIFDSTVRLHDTISAYFREKLDSVNSASGPIISLIIPKVTLDTIHGAVLKSDSTISSTVWLDAKDSSIIHILPTQPFTPGQNYAMKIALGGLTGDTTQDGSWGFTCRQSYRLNIIAAPTGALSCLDTIHFDPPINENYFPHYDSTFDSSTMSERYDTSIVHDTNYIGISVKAGDTVTYIAPTQVGGAVFKHWIGSGIPAIDTSTNPAIIVMETADQLRDLNIVALYGPVAVDTICVATAGANTPAVNSDFVFVRSDSQDCPLATLNDTCTSTSSVNYFMEQGKTVTLQAYSISDSIIFDHWQSSDTNINGRTNPTLSMQASKNTCATAEFGTGHGEGGCQYMIMVQIYNLTTGQYVNTSGDVASITGVSPVSVCSPTTWCSCDAASTLHTLTINLLDPTYGVFHYVITGPSPTNPTRWWQWWDGLVNPPFSGTPYKWTIPGTHQTWSTFPTQTYVTFYIGQVTHSLTIDMTLNDENTIPSPSLILPSTPPTFKPTSAWCSVDVQPSSYTGHVYTGDPLHTNCYQWVLIYPLSTTTVNITSGTASTSPITTVYPTWDIVSPNTDPRGEPTYPNPLPVTMDQNRWVTALYQEPFMLTKLAWYYIDGNGVKQFEQLNDPDNNWPPPVDATGVHPDLAVTAKTSYWDKSHPAEIDFWFNQGVVIYNYGGHEGNDYGPVAAEEDATAFDVTNQTDRTGLQTYTQNLKAWENSLWFGLSQGTYVWKSQKFTVDISDVMSDYVEHPSNKTKKFEFQTLGANVSWYYTNTQIHAAHDNFFFDSWAWVTWASMKGPHNAIEQWNWGHDQTCICGDVSNGTSCTAQEWADDPDGDGDDQTCTGSGEMLMVSESPVKSSDFFSAGASNSIGNYWCPTCWGLGVSWGDIYEAYLTQRSALNSELNTSPSAGHLSTRFNRDSTGTDLAAWLSTNPLDIWSSPPEINWGNYTGWVNGGANFVQTGRPEFWGMADSWKWRMSQNLNGSTYNMRIDIH